MVKSLNHTHGDLTCSERAPFYTLVRKTGLKSVLTGTMSDLQVTGGGVFVVCWREGGGGIPLMIRNRKIKFKNDKGFSFHFSFLFLLGDGGYPPIWTFFLKQTSKFDFRAQTNFEVPHWLDDMSREGRSRSQGTCIKGAHVGAKFKRCLSRVMSHVRRNIKFNDRVQVLEFKEKEFVANLLKGAKKDIPLHEGESEYTKKRRQ